MNSDNDLLHQPDSLQQPVMKKKSNSTWKVIFISLLIFNLIYLGYLLLYFSSDAYFSFFEFIGLLPNLLFLSIIDLIAIVSYIIKQHPHSPHGISKRIIIDTALIAAGLILTSSVIFIYVAVNLFK
jgi:hypothetical protein